MIPYSCQAIDDDDILSVVNALKSNHLTQGPLVNVFEKAIEEYCSSKYCIAVSSGTAALHIGMLALGINSKSTVWTSPITFVATANAALYCGATVDFVEIDPTSGNICIEKLEIKLQNTKKLPDLLAVVHFAGNPLDMHKIKKLSEKYGFKIIEDAAHAFGASYNDQTKVGNCRFSDLTILSFHAVKSITTAEGGACLTNDPIIYDKLLLLRTHGITRATDKLFSKDLPSWHYEQQILGYHYRLTELQAALGISQIKKLDKFIKMRLDIAKKYNSELLHSEITHPPLASNSAWHLYSIQVPSTKRDHIYNYCLEKGIGTNTHYQCVHKQPYYKNLFSLTLTNAEKFSTQVLSIPIHPKLSLEDQQHVISTIVKSLNV